ncbi:hypothetical protein [Gracilibacillus sp. YIM 98692]|uniref:hypothetical protein n=1 Tax=Gracilibacillus sp. YIM 98692 TaxID=2663532 RepID=UPI0013D77EBC|nr:hypothetical protein [Gracilibacillus sp. YIM 98692]
MNHALVEAVAEASKEKFDLANLALPEEYYYQSLPLCVIDAVFSIGVRYESTRNTVKKYCDFFVLKRTRDNDITPDINEQESVDMFIKKMDEMGIETFTYDVFQNKQRTSTTNGILKTEAVYQFCKVLQQYDVHYLQNMPKILGNRSFENEIKSIKGQGSGVSLTYFFMLAGSDEWIKPDRMILRFLEDVLGSKVNINEAQAIMTRSSELLKKDYPNLTPRLLDYAIWEYTRVINA